jgi:hypothetical protein
LEEELWESVFLKRGGVGLLVVLSGVLVLE